MGNWDNIEFQRLARVQGGFAFKSDDYQVEGALLVRIGNLQKGSISFQNSVYIDTSINSFSDFKLNNGDILIGLTGDLGKLAKIKKDDLPALLNQRVGRFLLSENTDSEFLYQLISSEYFQEKLKVYFEGGAQANISPKQIESVYVYTTKSKPEQTRIAQILSTADRAITQTEALIAKYQRIKTGLMQDLLTKGIDEHGNIRSEQTHRFKTEKGLRVPEEWEVNELRQYISYISYGFTNPMPEAPEGPYLITAANINEGRILYESCRRTTEKAFKELLTNKSRPKINDVLITKDGSLGRMAIVDRENLCINQSVAVMRTIPERIDFKFFKMLLESDSYQATIIGDAGGSTIKHIYITKIDKMLLAVPKDLDEQIRILNTIEKHNKLIEDSKNQLLKLQSLKTGLMQDLLSGKVRVNIKAETLVNP